MKNSRPPIYQYLTSSIHACPTGTPGNATRIHYVLNTVFQTPVSREEKKRRMQDRISSSCLFGDFHRDNRLFVLQPSARRTKALCSTS